MKCIFGMLMLFLILSFWVCVTRYTQNKHISAISPKKSKEDEVDFLHADKHKSFLQDGSIFWVCVTRNAQNTQNNKFAILAISLQYLKENVKDKIDFLSAGKLQRFLQIDAITLGV